MPLTGDLAAEQYLLRVRTRPVPEVPLMTWTVGPCARGAPGNDTQAYDLNLQFVGVAAQSPAPDRLLSWGIASSCDYGLKFRRVDGVYSRRGRGVGRPGTNKIEALEIATVAARHARTCAGLSLGIVAFSKAQSDMITEVLEHERRQDRLLDAFLREDKSENVFVKNIENVQGDERDVILISVGYGPQEPRGRLASMYFGPINNDGGERRLNVLFTRARVRCEVICSFDPGDIDLSRVSRDGPRVLRRFS